MYQTQPSESNQHKSTLTNINQLLHQLNPSNNTNDSLSSQTSSQMMIVMMKTPIPTDDEEHKSLEPSQHSLQNHSIKSNNNIVGIFITQVNDNKKTTICCPKLTLPNCGSEQQRACCPGVGVLGALVMPALLLPAIDYSAHAIDQHMEATTHHIIMGTTALVSTVITVGMLLKIADISFKSTKCTVAATLCRVMFTPLLIFALDYALNPNNESYDNKPEWGLWVTTGIMTLVNAITIVLPHYKTLKLFPRMQKLNNDGNTYYEAMSESLSFNKKLTIAKEKELTIRHAKEEETKQKAKEEETKQKAKEEETKQKRYAQVTDLYKNDKLTYDQWQEQLNKIDQS
jgi:hypothetical protein